MLMRPAVGCSSPATQRSVVVLPQPDGPSSTTISPAGDVKAHAVHGRPAGSELLAQLADLERRRHAILRRTVARIERSGSENASSYWR